MTPKEAYVAFNLTENIGSTGVGQLISEYGDVVSAWDAYPKKVSRAGGEVEWEREFQLAAKYGVTILTPDDVDYPSRLRETPGYPLVLYVLGDVKALSLPSVAMVGTRRATDYGRDMARKFASGLAEAGWMILSGLALGVDAASHRGALDAGGKTVGVIGSGLDKFYPEENRDLAREIVKSGGAVVSEFPFGRPPDTQTFPQRNHIVAALSSGVLVIEAPIKSGTLITTSIAADLGRTVMAVPGRIDNRMSAGCLNLIRDGATLVRNIADVQEALSELLPVSAEKLTRKSSSRKTSARKVAVSQEERAEAVPEAPKCTLEEAMIMRELDTDGTSLDSLVVKTGFPAEKVNALAMALRIKGRVRFLPGNRVALPRKI